MKRSISTTYSNILPSPYLSPHFKEGNDRKNTNSPYFDSKIKNTNIIDKKSNGEKDKYKIGEMYLEYK
jgi:hypothetical protein